MIDIMFLQNELITNVNMPQTEALQEAKAMIMNKRIVENNSYALLQENDIPRYFIRKDNKWQEHAFSFGDVKIIFLVEIIFLVNWV